MEQLAEHAGARADVAGLGALAARLAPHGDGLALNGAEGWMQGRTMYGGASSLLAYCAAQRRFAGLPPLRGAQIAFIAPVGDALVARAAILRQGRSVAQVETTLESGDAIAHKAIWVFGIAREDNGRIEPARIDPPALPGDEATVMPGPLSPDFIRRMEVRRAGPGDGASPAIRRWVRLRDRQGLDPIGELIGIGDALPPGSIRAMARPGPISSINWSFALAEEQPQTRDGWWLLESAASHLSGGFSTVTMRLWNTDGVEMMRGLQSIAVFG